MTLRERILAVFRGERPDCVPCMLDLSHWFYSEREMPWDLSRAYETPERELIDYHRENGVGFYLANLAALSSASWPDGVEATTEKTVRDGAPEIVWRITAPSGTIERRRVWEERTYAWGVSRWGVETERDLAVFREAMSGRTFAADWSRYEAWRDAVGDAGVVYLPVGYSAMGHLFNYWMGIERVVYASVDMPEALRETVDAVNDNILDLVDLVCASPAEVIFMGDNFSSDVQPPAFFDEWSRSFYEEAVRRIHAAGKCVAVHIDGKLGGALRYIRETGADCADAVTPEPMGDLTPAQCRAEAGPDFILSGGPSPDLWLPSTPEAVFREKLLDWLATRHESPRLIAAAGDQVPPGAEESRIMLMRDMVEEHGRY